MKKVHDELIVLDFDHTVFNTTAYVAELQRRFKKQFDIAPGVFMEQREAVKQCCAVVDIDNFVAILPHDNKQGMRETLLSTIRECAGDFTFGDAVPFIERHQPRFDILLLTHGDEQLQTEKLRASGVPDEVPFVVTRNDKGVALEEYVVDQYDRVYLIDDKAANLDAVKARFPEVEIYFMRRPEDRPYGDISPTCNCEHKEVTSLDFTLT